MRAFYEQFAGPVIVGLEASGYSPWFERLLEELGYEVWLGHATEIRRRVCRTDSYEVLSSLLVRVRPGDGKPSNSILVRYCNYSFH